MAAANHG